MFRPHLDHRVEQSRIIAYMLSLNRDLGFEFTSFCIAYGIWITCSILGFAWSQHAKRSVWPMEIMPFGICIKTILDSVEIWGEERYTPPTFQAPKEPLDLRVELPDTSRCSCVFDSPLDHGHEECILKLSSTISDDESWGCILVD